MIATERERGDVALARWLWHRGQGSVDPRKLVFVDETGTATNMAPLYGWGPKSERLVGSASHGHWRRTTFVGGLTLDGFIAPLVIEQAMNAAIFQAWIEQSLIPDMPKGAIVVMDNEPAYQGGHFWKPITPIRGQYSTPIHIFEGRLPYSIQSWSKLGRKISTLGPMVSRSRKTIFAMGTPPNLPPRQKKIAACKKRRSGGEALQHSPIPQRPASR